MYMMFLYTTILPSKKQYANIPKMCPRFLKIPSKPPWIVYRTGKICYNTKKGDAYEAIG
jgi:hypothetical protein